MRNGTDDAEAIASLAGALDQQLQLAKKRRPLWQPPTPKPSYDPIPARAPDAPEVDTPTLQIAPIETGEKSLGERSWWQRPEFVIGAIFIPILAAIIGGLIQNPSLLGIDKSTPDMNATADEFDSQEIETSESLTGTSTVANELDTHRFYETQDVGTTQSEVEITQPNENIITINIDDLGYKQGSYDILIEINQFEEDGIFFSVINTEAARSTAYAQWFPHISQGGYYEIEVYIPAVNATTRRARYNISGVREEKSPVIVELNQLSFSSEWVRLGIFEIDSSNQGAGLVSLNNLTGEGDGRSQIVFGPVRWTYINNNISLALDGVSQNSDWLPVEQDFDEIAMVLVPVGCFMMGSEIGQDDEKPVHQQCFDEPFWIDKYEVKWGDFIRLDGQKGRPNHFIGDNRPVESITWHEARDFCELRGGHLPTEREWEYAARGPDNLTYPWGNEWNPNNVVRSGNSSGATMNVDSIPLGTSWVGTLNMSGNVWEWVSTIYDQEQFPYPYMANDGRENKNITGGSRVLRGGSWSDYAQEAFLSFRRFSYNSTNWNNGWGFRCARPF